MIRSLALVAAMLGTLAAGPNSSSVLPPWSNGAGDPATTKGLDFTVRGVDDVPDFHGSVDDPKLVLFVGGNYYFAMPGLVRAFCKQHPQYTGRIFYVTIPPGLLVRAMKANGTFTIGNLTFTVHPDVFAAGEKKVLAQVAAGSVTGPTVSYARNDLTIMIPKGNPAHIRSLLDLGKPGVRIVMPNPAFEGVARQIKLALSKAGGPSLIERVYVTKVANGETMLTHVHHRQTPIALMQGAAFAGVTWKSEAIFQEQAGHPIAMVAIPPAQNVVATYGAGMVRGARHPEAARAWLHFLSSPAALKVLEGFGFTPPAAAGNAAKASL